jgi:hypothetical protein
MSSNEKNQSTVYANDCLLYGFCLRLASLEKQDALEAYNRLQFEVELNGKRISKVYHDHWTVCL